jgi:transposase
MIDLKKRNAIFCLHEEGMSVRQIAKKLHVARNTVRSIIDQKGIMPTAVRKDKTGIDPELLKRLHRECKGYVQRVHERLVEEERIDIKYSTLTRMLRDLGIGVKKNERCDRVPDVPGEEMQHDTSPYIVTIGENHRVKIVASLIYLRYSKRIYLKFYRRFNRFTMKCFFHEALMYWGYTAPICIIDNTNLARLRGTGKNAVMNPEMASFSCQYGFEFRCHEIGHSNRKAGNERGFWTIETNFFPGRNFTSLEDMNEQAFVWATDRLYHRPVGKAGLIPAKAFEHECASLIKLPSHLPAPYRQHERITDQYGFASIDGNFFWVPGTDCADVVVLEFNDHLEIYRNRELLAEYRLPPEGVKDERFSPDGQPKPRHAPKSQKKRTQEEETRLRAIDEQIGAWLDFALEPRGLARHRAIRELYRMSKQMTEHLFIRSVARAMKYRIRSIESIRSIASMYLSEGDLALPEADVDELLLERETYLEGRLTDEPCLSALDEILTEEGRDQDENQEGDHG